MPKKIGYVCRLQANDFCVAPVDAEHHEEEGEDEGRDKESVCNGYFHYHYLRGLSSFSLSAMLIFIITWMLSFALSLSAMVII